MMTPAMPAASGNAGNDLTADERACLRAQRVRRADLAGMDPVMLARRCKLPLARCRFLIAMAEFQTLGSVGPAAARDLWDLGCRSLADLAGRDPVSMYHDLALRGATALDPCVEDVFRCAIAQVRDPSLAAEKKNWWYWMPMRGKPMA